MADLHSLFQTFHKDVQILSTKKTKLSESKEKLRNKIRDDFTKNHPKLKPQFYIQGSYKMGSAIRTKDDTCDLDDGVYFIPKPDVEPTTLQGYVLNAVRGHTDEEHHRNKCITVIYKKNGKESYNIDLPVYYKDDMSSVPYLAIKNSSWQESNPREVVDWFSEKKKKKSQIVKIVRYLKAWCDHVKEKMPSGLAMTILASNAIDNITWYDNRDDVTLKNILKEIKRVLNLEFKCEVPAVPNDDLFANYSDGKKKNILTRLDSFIIDAEMALEEINEQKSSLLWKEHLGKWFPKGEDKDQVTNKTALVGLPSNKPWSSF